MTTDIDTAIKRIECGIGYGVLYLAHGLAIDGAKAIAEEWSRLAARGMIEYARFYPEKLYNKDKPLLQDTYTLLRGLSFNIDVTADSAIVYISIDDDVEPRNQKSIKDIFWYQTHGVYKKENDVVIINIPARPVFYDVLGQVRMAKAVKIGIKKRNIESMQYNFDNGFDKGRNYRYTNPATIMQNAKKSIKPKTLVGKISNYNTGELRWF